jgi:uncharacterized MnhB-related membrane protein
MFLKILYETITGDVLFADKSTFTPVALAHLTGSLVGIGVALTTAVSGSIVETTVWLKTLRTPRMRCRNRAA